jgi:2-dehydro-3-deoxyphosphogluconate aldolase/(4S)-4-hydroxy-2-oxoglutarate aldolase
MPLLSPLAFHLEPKLMNKNHWKIQPKDVLNAGPVMPVMVIQNLEDAVPLAKALVEGGIKVLEITLRTPVKPGS